MNIEDAITAEEEARAQQVWGEGIVAIGKAFTDKGDYVKVAENHLDVLYNFQAGEVLFKPTRALKCSFARTGKVRSPILSLETTTIVKIMVLLFIPGLKFVLKILVLTCMVIMLWPWGITFLPRMMERK